MELCGTYISVCNFKLYQFTFFSPFGNEGQQNDDEIIVYETVGVAAQDLVAAKIIYDKAVEAGKGLSWG